MKIRVLRENGPDRDFLTIIMAFLAVGLFVPLFAFRSFGPLDFWSWMSANIVVLLLLSFAADKSYRNLIAEDLRSGPGQKALLGIVSALLLYGFFFAANIISRQTLPFAGEGIAKIYDLKQQASPCRISLLLAFLIGPGEEIFWRGYLQRRGQRLFGLLPGFLFSTSLYGLVHLASGNLILFLAAAACGLFWGSLYLHYRSVLLIAVSHTFWDLLVFLAFPMR